MNKEFAAKWVAALRSGKAQTRGVLTDVGPTSKSYCCLGVACEILADEGKLEARQVGNLIKYGTTVEEEDELPRFDGSSYTLPDASLELLGAHEDFSYTGDLDHVEGARDWWMARLGEVRSSFFAERYLDLASLNDNDVSFADIADFIEAFADQL